MSRPVVRFVCAAAAAMLLAGCITTPQVLFVRSASGAEVTLYADGLAVYRGHGKTSMGSWQRTRTGEFRVVWPDWGDEVRCYPYDRECE